LPFRAPGQKPPRTQTQKQDGGDGLKLKNKMAAMDLNSKTRWRRWFSRGRCVAPVYKKQDVVFAAVMIGIK